MFSEWQVFEKIQPGRVRKAIAGPLFTFIKGIYTKNNPAPMPKASGSVILSMPAYFNRLLVTPVSQCAACRGSNSIFMDIHTFKVLDAHIKNFVLRLQLFI